MSTDAQLLVIGGGPVGLAAGIEARLAGIDVVVVEPRDGPIDKACGEGLMPGALRALDRLGVRVDGAELAGIAYVSGSSRAEHRFRSGSGRGVRRTELHAAIARRASEVGVPVVSGRVEALEQTGRRVIASGDGLPEISAAWAVAADGLHSHARRLLGAEGAPESPGRRRFGLRRHYRVPPWSDVVEVHWADEFEAYVTPLGPGLVGVALLGSWRRPADFDAELRAVPDVAARLAGAAADGPVRGAGPLRQRTVARVAGRVVLAGDASGYVDALTGEGLRVGFAQAEAAVRAVAAGDLSRYEREWSRATREARVVTSALVAAARSPLRGRIAPVARRRPELFGSVVERLAR